MFGSVRVIIMAVLFFGIAGAGVYVMKLRSDNAILKANQVLLEQSVESQKQVIQKQQQDRFKANSKFFESKFQRMASLDPSTVVVRDGLSPACCPCDS